MAERKDRIRVHIQGKEFSVVGGSFHEMLAAVKQINGRRFIGELKVWQLPGTVAEVQDQLSISNFQLEGGTPVTAETVPIRPTGDRIQVRVGEHRLAVVGGSFQDMLAAVKSLPGRRFDGETKTWEIPGDLGLIKGMIEAAGFQLEGAENIPLDPVPPMEPPDFLGGSSSPPYEPPDFFGDEDDMVPEEPPDWWDDDTLPPRFDDSDDSYESMLFDNPPSPVEAESSRPTPAPASGGDRIRIRVGQIPLIVSGGSFQEMLAAVKNIPGRRFNPDEKVWEIPEDVTIDSVQQALNAAGYMVIPE